MAEATGTSGTTADSGSEATFDVPLRCAPLLDLIQRECQRGSLGIVQVSSRGQDGLLYFRDGKVVHATTDGQTGEGALREMLAWEDGACETRTGVWPDRESITIPWQQLPEVAPAASRATATTATPPLADEATPRSIEWVTFSPDGRVVDGDLDSDLPGNAAHAFQLVSAIGEMLALDRFSTLEVSSDHEHVLVGWRADGTSLFAARAARVWDLEVARKQIEP